jgi:pimeloyl-ACP methyl ester carboxylesterase
VSSFVPWNSQPLETWASLHATGQFIELDGHSTHYNISGDGEPVILVHGFYYDSWMWADNVGALTPSFKVYTMDLWGCGYSTRQPLDYGYRLYVDQLLAFMDRLGIRKATLVGQSMGAGTEVVLALDHSDRVERLILVDLAGMPNPLPPSDRFFALPRVGEFFMGLRTDMVRKKVFKDSFIHDPAVVTDDYFENATRFQKIAGTTESLLSILRRRFFDTLSEEIARLGAMKVPTLIVWGREERAIPLDRGEAIHRLMPGSRFEIVDRAGHVPNSESPEAFNEVMLDFLATQALPSSVD